MWWDTGRPRRAARLGFRGGDVRGGGRYSVRRLGPSREHPVGTGGVPLVRRPGTAGRGLRSGMATGHTTRADERRRVAAIYDRLAPDHHRMGGAVERRLIGRAV